MQFHARIFALLSQMQFVQSIMGQEAAVVSNDMENCSENLYMSQINNCDKLYKFEPV